MCLTTALAVGMQHSGSKHAEQAHTAAALPELELRALTSTPCELLSNNDDDDDDDDHTHRSPVPLRKNQALQVVFSRPIIALGSDFGDVDAYTQAPFTLSCNKEGASFRFRWVTTSIARIDPVKTWPECDLRCTFSFKQNFTSYDGVPLQLNGTSAEQKLENYCPPPRPSSFTAPPKGFLQGVMTEWPLYTPTCPSDADEVVRARSNQYEVPPDARLHLSFNFEVTKDTLERNLQLTPSVPGLHINVTSYHTRYNAYEWRNALYQGAVIVPWGTPMASCQAEIVFSRPLEPNTKYSLQLSLEQIDVMKESVHGLRPFRLCFEDDTIMLRSKYFMLGLPHGLSPQNTPQQLLQQLRICENGNAVLGFCESESLRASVVDAPAERVRNSKVLVHVPELEAGRKYSILVQPSATIQDAFGQPLQASNGSFLTPRPPALFLRPSAKRINTLKPGSMPLSWPFLVKGDPGFCKALVLRLVVNDQESSLRLVHAIEQWQQFRTYECFTHATWEAMLRNLSDPIGQIETNTTEESNAGRLDLMLRPGYPVQLASMGRYVRNFWGFGLCWHWDVQLLLQANISASAWVSSSQDDLLAWVTHAGTDQQQQRGPVPGAHVFFFKAEWGQTGIIGSCHTNEQGFCHVASKVPKSYAIQLVAVVLGPAGDVLYLRMGQLYKKSADYPTFLGTLILDRAIVSLGDTLHVTGYVQEQSATGRLHAPMQNMSASLEVKPSWDGEYGLKRDEHVRMEIPLSEYGSLHAHIPVPKLAKPGRYSIYLRLDGDSDDLAKEYFVVSDPRPPTANLLLDAPAWSQPNAAVPIQVQAISYLGNQVSEADITVTWFCPGIPDGEQAVRTDDNGRAHLTIPLLGRSPEDGHCATSGGDLTVNAKWVGPTREPLFQTQRTKLDPSTVRVALSKSIDTNLPGVQFSPLVEVISNVNGTSLKGVPVAVSMAPVGLGNGCDVDAKCIQLQNCSVISGELLPECRLALPCMGTYCLKACTNDEFGTQTCGRLQVGWDTDKWNGNPISGFVQPMLHQAELRFKQGSTASLAFDSPYIGVALVAWGNSASQLKTIVLDVASPGRQLAQFPIGRECSGNCAVSVALSVPGISENARATCPPGVPVSKMFDCDRPQTLHMATRMIVEEDRSLEVKLFFSTADEDAPALSGADKHVFEPGQSIKLSASSLLGGEAELKDTEITLIAVDKAMLDMVSYGLPNVQDAFHVDLSMAPHHLRSLDPDRTNMDILEAITAGLQKHLQLSPWTGCPTWTECNDFDSPAVSIDSLNEGDCSHLAESIPFLTRSPNCWRSGWTGFPKVVAYKNIQGSCVFLPYSCPPPSLWTDRQGRTDLPDPPPPFPAPPPPPSPAPPLPPMPPADPSGPVASKIPADTPREVSEFVATPLFHALLPGTNTVEFNAPPKLSTYTIRAFAVSKLDGKQMYGQTEGELIVRRRLSLTPSLPRQVRVGDMFLGGVLATDGPEGGTMDVSVSITCNVAPPSNGKAQPIVLLDPEARTQISLTKDASQQEVRFAFNASALGTSQVHCSGAIEGQVMDSLLAPVPVLEQQLPVDVATSFAVRPSGPGMEEQHGEGLVLPDTIPQYGSLDVLAGLGHLPSVSASYESVAANMAGEPCPRGSASLFLATQPFIWSQYKQQLSDRQASTAGQAVSDLASLTSDHYGLLDLTPGCCKWCNRRVRSVTFNAWAAWAFSEASRQEEPFPFDSDYLYKFLFGGNQDILDYQEVKLMKSRVQRDLLPKWRAAIAQQLMAESEAQRYNPHKGIYKQNHNKTWVYSDLKKVAWARLALGARWDAPLCEPPSARSTSWHDMDPPEEDAHHTAWDWQDEMALQRQEKKQGLERDPSKIVHTCTTPRVQQDLSLHRLLTQAPAHDIVTHMLTALALQELEEPSMAHTDFVMSAADAVMGRIRVTGRTAYMAERVDSPSAKGYDIQALALQLLTRMPWRAENVLVQKLAAYVAQEDKHQSGGPAVFPFSQALTLMVNALAAYDVACGSATPDLKLEVSVAQTKDILRAHFHVASPAHLVMARVRWEDMPMPPGQLAVKTNGSGEVSLAVSLNFIPATVLRVPQYRGLWVENIVRAQDQESGMPVGPALTKATLGSMLSITVQVCTADDLDQVSLMALMPGGLEPIDPVLLSKDREAWIPMEVRAAAVHFFWPFMPAGTHFASFSAVAVTEGTFVLPPFKAFAENQPEVLGLTPGGSFQVTPQAYKIAIQGGNEMTAA